MTAQANKQVFERFQQEVVSAGNYDVADEVLDRDVVSHNPLPGQQPGLAGVKEALRTLHAAFPDLRVTPHVVIAEDDLVAGRFTVEGTHRGEFMGLQPTGKAFEYDEMILVRIADGRIVEHWAVADIMQMMLDLGAVAYPQQ